MLSLDAYLITDKIYESARSVVYRGQRRADHLPVVLKALRHEYPSPEERSRFRREYDLTQRLAGPGVVTAYDLHPHQNSLIMVLEDFGGESLGAALAGRAMSIAEFLRLAVRLAAALEGIHQHAVIHRDINPSNIVWNPESEAVKLIDFGIATTFTRGGTVGQETRAAHGTLAYMSPEQTGRMNRALDYRTDFYSLGATFYELLTGQPPFQAQDALGLIHAHIAVAPTPPHERNPAVPDILSAIVMKLLAKTGEERYQSAAGLRRDLEICLEQWETTGQIAPFHPGRFDESEHFQIPQTLYGRAAEIETLLSAFERVSANGAELLLVTGYPGIGKSALVNEIQKPVVRSRSYFISGKHDQFQRNLPYSALIQAFRSLMQQLMTESEEEIAAWRLAIREALGPQAQVILDVIPEVEWIIGPQPEVPTLSAAEAQNRFHFLFQSFIRLFARREHPLVLFLDDLQWADRGSLKLLHLILTDIDQQALLLIGSYRDSEVDAAHPLTTALGEMEQAGVPIHHIALGPLALPDVTQLVADTFRCSTVQAIPLAELVRDKTAGNPFFIGEFLKSLHEEGLVRYAPGAAGERGGWTWNIEQIRAHAITDNVVELMAGKVQRLDDATQRVLKLAACIGNQFDLQTLLTVHDAPARESIRHLHAALHEGLILPLSADYLLVESDEQGIEQHVRVFYKFAHDRVQQAVYGLLSPSEQERSHWQVGTLLLQHRSAEEQEQQPFDIVNQLNQGRRLLTEQAGRDELAALNLRAARRAKAAAAHDVALAYLQIGIELLTATDSPEGAQSWERQYALALGLHEEAVEAAFLNGDLAEMERLTRVVQAHAHTILEQVRVYEVNLQALIVQTRMLDALTLGRSILAHLGVALPEEATPADFMAGLQEAQGALGGKSIEDLYHLPPLTDARVHAVIGLLSSLHTACYIANPALMPLTVFKAVALTAIHGTGPASPHAYAVYGLLLANVLGDIETGCRFGELAIRLLERQNTRYKTATLAITHCTVSFWGTHLRETLVPLLEACQTGMETGDVENLSNCACQYCYHLFLLGRSLEQVDEEMRRYLLLTRQVRQLRAARVLGLQHQVVLALHRPNPSGDPLHLVGESFNEDEVLPLMVQGNDYPALSTLHINKLRLAIYFEEEARGVAIADAGLPFLPSSAGLYESALFPWYDSLALLSALPGASAEQRTAWLERVAQNQARLATWAQHAPMNFQHKWDLVAAEQAAAEGKAGEARERFDQAIAGAQASEYLGDEALAYHRAGRFYLAQGHRRLAQLYLQDARYAYQRWGAQALVELLTTRYADLFPSALPVSEHGLSTTITATQTGTQHGDQLDLSAVIKASQAIASELVLTRSLEMLMQTVMENAGAEKGLLLLEKDNTWVIEAAGQVGPDGLEVAVLQSLPAVPSQQLSPAVLHYVLRTRQSVVLDDASHEGHFVTDPYIQQQRPKSILCMPLLNRGHLTGLLYLENNLTTRAFTSDRLEVLTLLSSQAAISLDHARLYNTLEEKVEERTRELRQTLEHLRATQSQLVQAEKMAALGGLVAGVAHEINTPVGVGLTAASVLEERTRQLLGIYESGQMKRSDLQKYLDTAEQSSLIILSNLNRAAELIQSFKQVAVDQTTEERRPFLVKEYIQEVLVSLQPRLKRTSLTVTVDGDANVEVDSYPGAWAQILTNLVMNSILHAYDEGEAGHLSVEVAATDDRLVVRYRDDGRGIPPENLAKLYSPFFTTRRGAGGSGLGMHIVFNLVTQRLHGQIDCRSQVGQGTTFTIDVPRQSGA